MAYEVGTATDYLNLLSKLKDFVTRANTVTAAVANPGNTGNGTCSQPTADNDAPTELWTLTAINATSFSVVGSISGAQANATVGSAYDSIVQFTITAGGTPFVAGDIFTFNVTWQLGTEVWTVNEYDTAGSNHELYLQGPGATSTDELFVAIRTEFDVTEPFYIWVMQGATNYSSQATFHEQIGSISQTLTPLVLLDNASLKYWFIASGRRVAGVVKVGTIYAPFYFGFPLVYGLPDAFPYPMCIGGSSAYTATTANKKWSSTAVTHRGYPNGYTPDGDYSSVASLMVLSGAWSGFGNYNANTQTALVYGNQVWPGNYGSIGADIYGGFPNDLMEDAAPLLDGSFQLFPLVLCQKTPSINILGELDSIYAVNGIGVLAEDEITISGTVYKVFQNTYHTEAQDYFAMKLV